MKTMAMKAKVNAMIVALALTGSVGIGHVYAGETVGEKAEATANDAARAVKKGAHRAEEAVCMEGDAKCLAEKAKHRAQEAGDYTKDKAKEVKNSVDNDEKK
jgi:hypothetical protein